MIKTEWNISRPEGGLLVTLKEGAQDKLFVILFQFYFPVLSLGLAAGFFYLDYSGLYAGASAIAGLTLFFGFSYSWVMVSRLNPVQIKCSAKEIEVARRRLWMKPCAEVIEADRVESISLEKMRPSARLPEVALCQLQLADGKIRKVASLKEGMISDVDPRKELEPLAAALAKMLKVKLK